MEDSNANLIGSNEAMFKDYDAWLVENNREQDGENFRVYRDAWEAGRRFGQLQFMTILSETPRDEPAA